MKKNTSDEKKRNVNFKMDEKLFRQFKTKTTKNNITITGFFVESIKQYLRRENATNN